MSETKKELRWFSIMDYEKEARYLSRMHQKGWKFKRVTMPGIYTFEKCEPEKVIYQLDYNQEGMKNQMEYVKMFEDCGWEYLLEFAGYSYFRKPAAEATTAEEIFCDETSRQEMLDRIFKGRVVPLMILFFLVLVPEFVWSMHQGEYAIGTFLGAMTGFYVFLLTHFVCKYNALRRRKNY